MAHTFPSPEWVAAYGDAINASEGYRKAGREWTHGVVAMVVKNLQVGIEAGTNQLRQVDRSIEEASAALGASGARTFLRVTVPLLRPALFAALAYAFARSLTTLSAVIFLVSAQWTLVTVTILSHVETLKIGLAAAYCVILIVVVLAALAVLQAFAGGAARRS